MTPDQFLAFLLFAVVAAVTPGPSNIILTSTGAAVGVIRGLPCLFGASLGMGSIVFAAGAGLGSLVLGNAVLLTAVKWLASPSCSGCPGKSPRPATKMPPTAPR